MKAFVFVLMLFFILIIPFQGHAQRYAVSGFIMNQNTNNQLPDVSVVEKNSGIGTISNREGFFRLILRPGEKHIEFSSTGFEPLTSVLYLQSDTTLQVELIPVSVPDKSNMLKDTLLPESYVMTGKSKIKNKRSGN